MNQILSYVHCSLSYYLHIVFGSISLFYLLKSSKQPTTDLDVP